MCQESKNQPTFHWVHTDFKKRQFYQQMRIISLYRHLCGYTYYGVGSPVCCQRHTIFYVFEVKTIIYLIFTKLLVKLIIKWLVKNLLLMSIHQSQDPALVKSSDSGKILRITKWDRWMSVTLQTKAFKIKKFLNLYNKNYSILQKECI